MILAAHNLTDSPAKSAVIVDWEDTDCLLCGSNLFSTLVEAPDTLPGGSGLWFGVVQCQKCGLCFTNPRPSATSIHRFYPPTYLPHRTPEPKPETSNRVVPGSPRRHRGRKGTNPPHQGMKRLLDFGCGGGKYLARMHEEGWQVTGLDVSEEAIHRIRYALGLQALVGTLPCRELTGASFDVITMWQTLEHVHQPLEVLREAHRLLAPGGKLLVTVPNIDSLPFRLFGHTWLGLDLPRHLTHFTPPTLHALLERAGFHPGPIRMLRHSSWLRTSAKMACRMKGMVEVGWHRWLRSKMASRLVTWYSFLTSQSDCLFATARR